MAANLAKLRSILGVEQAEAPLADDAEQPSKRVKLRGILGIEGALEPVAEAPPEPEVAPSADISVFDPFGAAFAEEPQAAPRTEILKELAKPEVFRPTLEATGLAVGGALAVPAAVAAGPFAPAVEVLGAGLGFTAGKNLADFLESISGVREPKTVIEELKEVPLELIHGAEFEMGGRAIVPAIRYLVQGAKTIRNIVPAFSRKRLEAKAGETLLAHTSEGRIYAENVAQAKAIEKRIPGIKFTKAQLTKDARLVQLERNIELTHPNLLNQQRADAAEALGQKLDEVFPARVGFEGAVDAATAQKVSLQTAQQSARTVVDAEVANLSRGMDIQESGRVLHANLQGLKAIAKGKATELYDKVPNVQIDIKDLRTSFISILKPKVKGEPLENMPDIMRRAIKDTFGDDPTLGFKDLRGLRTVILNEKRKLSGIAAPNPSAVKRLEEAQSAVEATINSLDGVEGEAANAFREASAFYKTFSQQFKQGTVADVLRRGSQGEDIRIGAANVAGQFFKGLDSADDFIRAAGGDDAARIALKDFASQDLLKTLSPSTGEIVPAAFHRWFGKNKAVLERLGLTREFAGIKQAQRMADSAKGFTDNFNKSVASEIIGVDAERAFAQAFAGKRGKQTGQVAQELLAMVKGDKQAVEGLKKALKDHISSAAELASIDLNNNPIRSASKIAQLFKQFEPAMNVLYRNDPKKMQALRDMRQVYLTLERNIKSPINSGSDTLEKVITTGALGTFGVVTKKFALTNLLRAVAGVTHKYSQEQVQHIVAKALIDPEYAHVLMQISRGKMAPKAIESLLDNRLLTVPGLYGLKKLSEDEPEEQFELEGY
jgi:hypothetical protein